MKSQTKCKNCDELTKKLRIAKSDYDFEIKKLSEDMSTEKALFQISMQKEIKKVMDKYLKQKNIHEETNKKWMEKYDLTLHQTDNKINQILNQTYRKIQLAQDNSNRKIAQFKHHKQLDTIKRINQTQDTWKIKLQQVNIKCQEQKAFIKHLHQKQIINMQQSHQKQISLKIKQYESIINGLKCQKKTSQSLFEISKKQSQQKQTKLYQQLYTMKKKTMQLSKQIESLKQINVSLNLSINNHIQSIQRNIAQNIKNIQRINQQHQQQIEQLKNSHKNELKQVYQKFLNENNKYQGQLKRIEDNIQNQKKIYKKNMQEVKHSIEERPSKSQDLDQIKYLRQTLEKRDKDIIMILEQLKWYRLQLQNKQQTYNRMFVSINNNINNENPSKKKQFKLRRAGKSVVTVRQALGNNNLDQNKNNKISKIL